MQSKVISRKKFSSLLAYSTLYFDMADVSRTRALNEPKTAKLAEMRAEFCIFESNAPGLKANFYEPYVDKPIGNNASMQSAMFDSAQVRGALRCYDTIDRVEDQAVVFLARSSL